MTTTKLDAWARDPEFVVPEWTLGDRMRKAMEHAGLTVSFMADAFDVGPATISRWTHDKGPVKRSTLRMWAVACGVDLDWLETGYAIRDSNPEPADSERRRAPIGESVNRRLTPDRPVAVVVDLAAWQTRRAS